MENSDYVNRKYIQNICKDKSFRKKLYHKKVIYIETYIHYFYKNVKQKFMYKSSVHKLSIKAKKKTCIKWLTQKLCA